jgi:hypothetical protein
MNRKSGITTRLADSYVQYLFSNPNTWIEVKDNPSSSQNNSQLLTRVKLRLINEHKDLRINERDGQLMVCTL